MTTYKVKNLSNTTASSEQTKLISALKTVQGVENATLQLQNSTFEITPKAKQVPKKEDLSAACNRVGFPFQS